MECNTVSLLIVYRETISLETHEKSSKLHDSYNVCGLSEISRDHDPIFYLTRQSTKVKMLHTNKHVTCKYF